MQVVLYNNASDPEVLDKTLTVIVLRMQTWLSKQYLKI